MEAMRRANRLSVSLETVSDKLFGKITIHVLLITTIYICCEVRLNQR